MSKSKNALQTYRSGYRRMWDFARDHLIRWKIPEPDSWPKNNLMGGVMWSSPQEYRKNALTGARCARVLELAWERGVTLPVLKLIRKSCSFLHLLSTGTPKSNFPEVAAMFKTLDVKQCAPKTPLLPTRVITPEAQRRASISESGNQQTN